MKNDLSLETPKAGETYRHQNGIDYRVECLARVDNEDQDLLVVASGPDGVTWARKIGNFMGLRGDKARFVKTADAGVNPIPPALAGSFAVMPIGQEYRIELADGTALYVSRRKS